MSRQQPKAKAGKKRRRQNACGKRRYRDHAEAVAALRLVRASGGRPVVPARCYSCDRCGGWHLTSQR